MKAISHRILHLFLPLLAGALPATAQVQGLDEGSPDHQTAERLMIRSGSYGLLAPGLKPYNRETLTSFALSIDDSSLKLTRGDRADLQRLFRNNNEWLVQPGTWESFSKSRSTISFQDHEGRVQQSTSHVEASRLHERYELSRRPLLKHFYTTPANFYEHESKYFYVKASPLLRFGVSRSPQDGLLYANQRGARIRGAIDERIYFSAEVLESQVRFPEHVRRYADRQNALPGNGLLKPYRSRAIESLPVGYDFLNAQGYVGFRLTPHVHAQFGHGRHFIGSGYRSLLLSDFSNNYLYAKVLTQVGRFYYQNLFAELSAISANGIAHNQLMPRKYMAAHFLGMRLAEGLNFGVYEAVIMKRSNQFELQYLNPIIFYRSVEHLIGSPDNTILGTTLDWRFLRRYQLYGQVVIDEFRFRDLFTDNRGWWGNKYGIQAGFKALDLFGTDHLDLQMEYNCVRPYTYQHFDTNTNYTHYNLPLAHPLGANFEEGLAILRWQPAPRWALEGRAILALKGEDMAGKNYGSNILSSYNNRPADYGVRIGQGDLTEIRLYGADISYEAAHQLWLQASWMMREQRSGTIRSLSYYVGAGIRWNLPDLRMDF